MVTIIFINLLNISRKLVNVGKNVLLFFDNKILIRKKNKIVIVTALSKYNAVTYLFHLRIKSRIINLQIKFLKFMAKSRARACKRVIKFHGNAGNRAYAVAVTYIPAFNKTIWSSCESFMNPGTILANSMICWMTVVSFWAHSSQSCSCAMFL